MSFQIQINSKTRNTLFVIILVMLIMIPLVCKFALKQLEAAGPQSLVYLITFCSLVLIFFALLFLAFFTKDKENKI